MAPALFLMSIGTALGLVAFVGEACAGIAKRRRAQHIKGIDKQSNLKHQKTIIYSLGNIAQTI
jgi:hypothetical protein